MKYNITPIGTIAQYVYMSNFYIEDTYDLF